MRTAALREHSFAGVPAPLYNLRAIPFEILMGGRNGKFCGPPLTYFCEIRVLQVSYGKKWLLPISTSLTRSGLVERSN